MNKNILKLAIPSIFANITVPLVGMADLAIAGRLGDATLIGGIAIATMLFDLLYWNMGFLRVGTGGLIAQAYGRRDLKGIMSTFAQGLFTALSIALLIWAIQYFFLETALYFIDCSPQVQELAKEYYYIRIWAAPATLSLFVFKGFFIGMQNAVSPMIVDVTINVVNVAASLFFAIYAGFGFSGIAIGTLIAQYTGLSLSIAFTYIFYKKLFKHLKIRESIKISAVKNFFIVNANLFVRSICFLFIYTGFTSLSAKFGDTLLASGTIMMKLMLLYSYFIDGFAYAAEALTGRYVGAADKKSLTKAVKLIFAWCTGIGIISTFMYIIWGEQLCMIMTDNTQVLEQTYKYLPWLFVMPLISCWAFTWDGIYIGATATKTMRNAMIYAVLGFFAAYYLCVSTFNFQALWIAYMVHLVVRATFLSIKAKNHIFFQPFSNQRVSKSL